MIMFMEHLNSCTGCEDANANWIQNCAFIIHQIERARRVFFLSLPATGMCGGLRSNFGRCFHCVPVAIRICNSL